MGDARALSRRRRRAAALVAVPLVVVALWNPVSSTVGAEVEAAPAVSGWQFAADVFGGEDVDNCGLSQQGGRRREEEVPEWFSQEVMPLEGAREVRANGAWSVVGFVRDEAPDDALALMVDAALQRGWQLAESGADGVVTGTKASGRCRWMAISCTAVGDETCVVVQLPTAS